MQAGCLFPKPNVKTVPDYPIQAGLAAIAFPRDVASAPLRVPMPPMVPMNTNRARPCNSFISFSGLKRS
jgi:hypothetical protein